MKKFKVIRDLTDQMGLKIGDIVTLVEGSSDNDLYELPENLHGKGHDGSVYDSHLDLRGYNYVYLYKDYIQEINDDEYKPNSIKQIRLDITYKDTKVTTRFLVESIEVVGDVLSFKQNGLTKSYCLDNYTFTINGDEIFS